MKKSRILIAILLVAVLFSSCNADLVQNQKGIFESMMTSAPNTDYTIQKFSGVLDDKFIIETNNGIELLDENGVKTSFITGLKASMRFIEGDYLVYSTETEGQMASNLKYIKKNAEGKFIHTDNDPAAVIKNGETVLNIEASFYEELPDNTTRYVLLMADKNGKHYFAISTDLAGMTDGTFSFTKCNETKAPEDGKNISTPKYIGAGYYYVRANEGYYVYTLNGDAVNWTADTTKFDKLPMAVQKNILFVQGDKNNLYTINGTTVAPITEGKPHSLSYQQLNQDIAMTTFGDIVYGFYGSKPFSASTAGFTEYDSIGSGVNVIDLTHRGGKVFAFSADNGLYTSPDGKTFTRANN